MTGFTGVAAAVIPVIAGHLYDTTQSYEITIWIVLAILVLSALLFAILRPPTQPARLVNPTQSSA